MPAETPPKPADPAPGARSRRRRNVIGRSAQRDEYVRLMEAGWSSMSLERYAAFRYGEDVPSKTFRDYRAKMGIAGRVKPFSSDDAARVIDVVGVRADLIRLQLDRIGIDHKHEQAMSKLFGSTSREIGLLSSLLTDHKGDLQDLGVMPKAGEKLEISGKPTAEEAPRALTLGALLGVAGGADEREVARALHLVAPLRANGKAG